MIFVILGVIAILILEITVIKKFEKVGIIFPIISLVFLVYEYATKSKVPGFVYGELLFHICFFVIVSFVWAYFTITKKRKVIKN
jgi:hypothetical protein